MSKSTRKGAELEEVLRSYFLRGRHYVARGAKIVYGSNDATDVDLWLYIRCSAISRERVNVDARVRRRAAAAERVFWTKGVQTYLGLDRCIVATTDTRQELQVLARRAGVLILNGSVISRLKKSHNPGNRLSEEEFETRCHSSESDPLFNQSRSRLDAAKSRLLTSLDFDGCNKWLQDAARLADVTAKYQPNCEPFARLLYLVISMFLVGLDFSTRTLWFEDNSTINKKLIDGFRFGNEGQERMNNVLDVGSQLLEKADPTLQPRIRAAKESIYAELDNGIRAESLAEFFGKADIRSTLFELAKSFESAAYQREFKAPRDLSSELRAVLGAIADFNGLERRFLLG